MKMLKNMLKNIIARLWIKQKLKKEDNVQYFFCPAGIGDTLYVLSYMKEYRKKHPDKKITFIVKKSHMFIIKMYENYVDDTIIISQFYFKAINYYLKANLKNKNRILYAHPQALIYDPCKILGIKNICLLDLYKVLLNIPSNAKYDKPHINIENRQKIIEENGIIHNKSILLCPYCVSIQMIDKKIWDDIAKKYIDLGYKVFTNIKDETEKPILNTIPLNLKLDDFYSVIEEFEHVYAIRSGLCDLMAFSNVNLTVFYPKISNEEICKTYTEYNFKNIGIRKNIEEIIVNIN